MVIALVIAYQFGLGLYSLLGILHVIYPVEQVGSLLKEVLSLTKAAYPVLYTVALYSPSVLYTHDFRPENCKW